MTPPHTVEAGAPAGAPASFPVSRSGGAGPSQPFPDTRGSALVSAARLPAYCPGEMCFERVEELLR